MLEWIMNEFSKHKKKSMQYCLINYVIKILTEIRDTILVIQKLLCIRKKLENWKILKPKHSLFIMKLKVASKKIKIQVRIVRRRNKKIRKNISIRMKLCENLRILNPQYLTMKWNRRRG